MSRNFNTNAKKPYCKVCHDAGKPESEYTSHWVKSLPDRSGKSTVTCPTLLSNECRYCFKLGHTAKFCPVIEQNKKDQARAERRAELEQKETQKKAPVKPLSSRGFAVLQEDSDSEVEEIKVSKLPTIVVEEFPALGAPSKPIMAVHLPSVKPEAKTGWAAAVSKPKVEQDTFLAKIEERSIVKNLPQSALKPKAEPAVRFEQTGRDYSKEIYTRNWADWTDSDSDDDEPVAPVISHVPPMPYKSNFSSDVCDLDW